MQRIDSSDFAALRHAFAALAACRDAGPAGTMIQDSGRPGPTVGITMMTHGNEPAGLAAWDMLTRQAPLSLLKGRVVWVLNNLKAAEHYFALPFEAPFPAKQRTRAFERNMNRLPRNLAACAPGEAYEIDRSLALLPVWQGFDVGLDIHTTSQSEPPMLCVTAATDPALYCGFPAEDVILGFDKAARDAVVLNYFGRPGAASQSFSIEAGGHEDAASRQVAATAVRILLGNLGMTAPIETRPVARRLYRLSGGVFFPAPDYAMVEIFPNFAPIRAGQLLAQGPGPDLVAPHDGHVLMCPKSGRLSDIREEAVFLSAPVELLAAA
jgi:predicted deacylase